MGCQKQLDTTHCSNMSPANNYSQFLGISKSPTSAESRSAGGLHKTFTGMTNPFATELKKPRTQQQWPRETNDYSVQCQRMVENAKQIQCSTCSVLFDTRIFDSHVLEEHSQSIQSSTNSNNASQISNNQYIEEQQIEVFSQQMRGPKPLHVSKKNIDCRSTSSGKQASQQLFKRGKHPDQQHHFQTYITVPKSVTRHTEKAQKNCSISSVPKGATTHTKTSLVCGYSALNKKKNEEQDLVQLLERVNNIQEKNQVISCFQNVSGSNSVSAIFDEEDDYESVKNQKKRQFIEEEYQKKLITENNVDMPESSYSHGNFKTVHNLTSSYEDSRNENDELSTVGPQKPELTNEGLMRNSPPRSKNYFERLTKNKNENLHAFKVAVPISSPHKINVLHDSSNKVYPHISPIQNSKAISKQREMQFGQNAFHQAK